MIETGVVLVGKIALQALISESVKNIVNKKWRLNTDSGKKILEHFQLVEIADKYSSKIRNNVLTFRSLSQGGKNVGLEDVYCPLRVTVKDTSDTFLVTDDTVIKHKGIVVISGSAGQGKTTVLRKLFIEEIKRKERFPFFITMRNVIFRNNITLIEIFISHLQDFGIDVKEEDASLLLQSSNVVLFFDGFDEIPNNERIHALNVLKSSWNRYTCQVIVTTRPNTELYREGGFKNITVNPLMKDDVTGIISKSVGEVETREALIKMLENKTFILDALMYPILVDIFIVSFYSMKDTPATIGDFYSGLFRSLLFSHDQQKNFTRERVSGLDVNELQDCFNCFSLLSFLGIKQDFDESELDKYFIEACDLLNKKEAYKKIKSDIIDGTNLISLNGYKYYSYIHRSIQEYHAALYISSLDDAAMNYKRLALLTDYSYMTFLSFLESIDDKKFYLYYVQPYLRSLGLENILTGRIYDKNHIIRESILGSKIHIRMADNADHLSELRLEITRGDKFIRRFKRLAYLYSLLSGSLNNESLNEVEVLNLDLIDELVMKKEFFSLACSYKSEVRNSMKNDKSSEVRDNIYEFDIETLIKTYPDIVKFDEYYGHFVDAHKALCKIYSNKINPRINIKNPSDKIRTLIKKNPLTSF